MLGPRVQWSALPYPTPEGQVGGHEGVGEIVKLGPGSEEGKLKVGDRVGVKWVHGTCGNCRKQEPLWAPLVNCRIEDSETDNIFESSSAMSRGC